MSDFMYRVGYGSTPAGKCHFITHFLVVVCSLPWNSKRSIIRSNVSGRILSCGLPVMLCFNGCLSSLLSNFCGIFLPYLKLLPRTVWYTASAANRSCAYSILDLTVSNQLSVRVSHISSIWILISLMLILIFININPNCCQIFVVSSCLTWKYCHIVHGIQRQQRIDPVHIHFLIWLSQTNCLCGYHIFH